jgi:hypothetical protein
MSKDGLNATERLACAARAGFEACRVVMAALGEESPRWRDLEDGTRLKFISMADSIRLHPERGPEALHGEWCEGMRNLGWIYGDEGDREAKIHPFLIEYERLPYHIRTRDRVFYATAKAVLHG